MINFDQKTTDIAVMELTSRHRNGRHTSRPKKDLIFAPPHFLKGTKDRLLTLNFLSRFLSHAPFSTFANRASWFVGKFAKELKPTRKAKSRAKKPALYTKNLVNLKIKHHKL